MHNYATLPLLLKQLNLPCMYAAWQEVAVEAEQERWQYPEYLTTLANREFAGRQQKRIERHIKQSLLPPGKTLDTFDFKMAKSINPTQIETL